MKILITGATGFVGDAIVREALAAGHGVRVLARHVRNGSSIQTGAIESCQGDVTEPGTLTGCMDGVDAVIHLVGIIFERGPATFERVHVDGTVNVLTEARRCGVQRLLHMSALGTRPAALSRYHQTKWRAEEAVRASGLDWTIFRPSVIYGPRDEFINRFAEMLRPPLRQIQLFTLPIIGGGNHRLQPVPVQAVAQAFVRSLTTPSSIGRTYDLCGPTPLSLKELLRGVAAVMDKRCIQVSIPIAVARLMAGICEAVMARPLLTRDQIRMLQEDNAGDPSPAARDFQLELPDFRTGISRYLQPSRAGTH